MALVYPTDNLPWHHAVPIVLLASHSRDMDDHRAEDVWICQVICRPVKPAKEIEMRKFESWFAESRGQQAFRDEYETYVKETRACGIKPMNPKSWAYDRFEYVENALRPRPRPASKRRIKEITSAIVRYEDYPT